MASRKIYEDGGWNDGRIGQAYDLIADVIREHGERTFSHPLLKQIEQFDEDLKGAEA